MQTHLAILSRNLLSMQRPGKAALTVATDCVALPLCFLTAMLLRVADLGTALRYGLYPYAVVPAATILAFRGAGLYQAVIRFIDKSLLVRTGGVLAAVVLLTLMVSWLGAENPLPRSTLVIYWFIALSYVVVSRLSVRAFLRLKTGMTPAFREPVGIFGAGEAGVQLALAMRNDGNYQPVCFFDDKLELHNSSLAGLKVYSTAQAAQIGLHADMHMVVLAIPSAPAARRRQVMHTLRTAGLAVKTMNSLIELSDDAIGASSIRELKIEDLLGREPVPPRQELFAKCVHGKNVLVTGAGGSIGSELCRQIATLAPRHLHLLEHSEYALYSIEQELRNRFPHLRLHAHLGSVCDARLVQRVIRHARMDTVYHAAAYKHVPVVEINMAEGIRNNVIGAQVVVDASQRYKVKTCVLISTDKAVRPTNIMGATKRISELIFQAAAARSEPGGTVFSMVRLGNVLGSSGSVIPLFRRQIEGGGPVTITHPEVVRYFMLIPEAAQLVIQAGAMAAGGDLFVLDMGEPIRIVDLARTMIEMAGLTEKSAENPHGDIEIRYVGLRPGEKLYEELLIGDDTRPSDHPRIMCANEYAIHPALLQTLIERLMVVCRTNDATLIRSVMRNIVREYSTQGQQPAPGDHAAPAEHQLPAPIAPVSGLRYRPLVRHHSQPPLLSQAAPRATRRTRTLRAQRFFNLPATASQSWILHRATRPLQSSASDTSVFRSPWNLENATRRSASTSTRIG